LPTLIWGTDRIDLAAPGDSTGRHVWSVEVLVGGYGPGPASAIVTFDREDGPAYLYRLEPAAVASLQAAMGLAPTTAPRPPRDARRRPPALDPRHAAKHARASG